MTILLWTRTKRRLNTYSGEEVDLFLDRLRDGVGAGIEEPFTGGDQLLTTVLFSDGGINGLNRLLSPLMKVDFVDDWSLTEVGGGIGPETEPEVFRDGLGREHIRWDSRFVHYSDLQLDDGDDFEHNDLPYVPGLEHLNWRLTYDPQRKVGLWVDFTEDLDANRYLITSIERALPGKVMKMWQGRSSLLFAYLADHDMQKPNAYGVTDGVGDILDDERVSYWLAFQIGNVSVGGLAENLNPMRDFIWGRKRSSEPSGNRQVKRSVSKRPEIVVKKDRPLANAPVLKAKGRL